MEDRTISSRIEKYNRINELIVNENDYLNILKSYCENASDKSETIARILLLVSTLCEMHEKLYEEVDELIIDIGV